MMDTMSTTGLLRLTGWVGINGGGTSTAVVYTRFGITRELDSQAKQAGLWNGSHAHGPL